ncbi:MULTISPECIES: hypothetical protein [unclassified Ruegeria]|uniref:hypothetical protein n=1 Tax=unclassified Ruegeria TaxID=2625375 RepID=UPI001ADAB4C5|nr:MULTISPECIES: hypothetical protein [unclassified Ruegeria]MBO9411573.1 hypothetical protein [Ruegeria sp. R8_1]MBO9415865.1 hypothetical protein [Ruegeria sp. R8_2]
MPRLTTISTLFGLTGLMIAMMTALNNGASVLVALGFVMMTLGFAGAVIGAAISVGRMSRIAR